MRWQHRHQMRSDRQLPAFVAADYRRLLRARSRNFYSRAAKCPLRNRGFSSIFVSLWHLSDLAGRADDVCCWGVKQTFLPVALPCRLLTVADIASKAGIN